ncbi:Trp biosynthesis-associated membrane protein [Galbitalea soli]|uniref:Trp biosynthesis-associated membrane protein n=1 Tax=Galbitalea soli TaxID=1268042 RepID=A0A7C9PLD8_9MICO|nr:Trp biosynthesis-associated membrane protein [Galbitalea soli]NEM90193.1 Trp biosynthesis-associated membrane protein [Galbitalea soli]NYJ30901.1 hypothetical protein [Galbitalea soli]
MTAKRLRLTTIVAIAALAALTLLTTTQSWWTIHLQAASLTVQGSVAAPALAALSLSGLALAGALAIAGPVFRVILGVLQIALGGLVVLTSSISVGDPVAGSESVISHATGVAGVASIRHLVQSVSQAPWGVTAIILGGLSVAVGLVLLATFRRWPSASRRYQAVRLAPEAGPRDAVIDWDALSEGDDPTAEREPID